VLFGSSSLQLVLFFLCHFFSLFIYFCVLGGFMGDEFLIWEKNLQKKIAKRSIKFLKGV